MRDKHKVRIRKNANTYTEWLDASDSAYENGQKDIISGENRWEGQSPFAQIPLSDIESDRLEALQDLYPTLKGRQKQIVGLLFDGFTSQTEMAKELNMRQSHVADELRKIMKKILKKVG
jgi:DNA-directed RNA polymerase specialized sigma subunit